MRGLLIHDLQELDLDRSALRQQQKELQRQHGQLQADQAVKQMRLSELTDKCRDVQLLKFGQVIDIALLDTIGVRNKGADELRDNLKHQVIARGYRHLNQSMDMPHCQSLEGQCW